MTASASASALDNVLGEAQAAAANFVPPAVTTAPANLPTPVNDNSTGTALAKPTMDGFMEGNGMSVDEYLTSKAEGFRIGKDMKGLLDEITVSIDMLDVVPVYCSSHETGGQTKFLKSYDGVTTPSGENFRFAYAQACAQNSNNKDVYKTVEIPATLLEDVKDPKSALTIPEGTEIGITPSMTGFSHFEKFHKKLRKKDPALLEATLKVKITHTKRTNSRNNEWGVVDFELIETIAP